jgi:REP element-mobilizing transposase RayT
MEASMPQSLSLVVVHIVFSTKDRFPCLDPATRPRLHAYLATVARNVKCEGYRVGGTSDHVHLAVRLSRMITVAGLVEELKTSSSKWLKRQRPELGRFGWQRGYGAFSVSPAELGSLVEYVNDQEEHHKVRTFEEEYLALLKESGVQYDARYMWD